MAVETRESVTGADGLVDGTDVDWPTEGPGALAVRRL
jgi:hypothetical protein